MQSKKQEIMKDENIRIKLPERLWWYNTVNNDRIMLIDCIYEQKGMLGLIKLNEKSITCNKAEKEMVKEGIKKALQYLKKNDKI